MRRPGRNLLELVDVTQDTAWHTHRQDRQVTLGPVLHATRDIDHHTLVQLDLLVVQDHAALTGNHVIEFIGALMVMQFGILDFHMMDLPGGAVLLLDQATNLATSLPPGLDLGGITTQEAGLGLHENLLALCVECPMRLFKEATYLYRKA